MTNANAVIANCAHALSLISDRSISQQSALSDAINYLAKTDEPFSLLVDGQYVYLNQSLPPEQDETHILYGFKPSSMTIGVIS